MSLTTYIDRVTCLVEQGLIVDKAYKVLHIKSVANRVALFLYVVFIVVGTLVH